MSTKITVIGTIGNEPKEIVFNDGNSRCQFRVVSNDRYYDAKSQTWEDGAASWFSVNVYRTLGANAMQSLSKGQRVVVHGRLRVRDWTGKDGSGHTVAEIEAESVGADLMFGTAVFTKNSQNSADGSTAGGRKNGAANFSGEQVAMPQWVAVNETETAAKSPFSSTNNAVTDEKLVKTGKKELQRA
ncbi:MAG: single-stranded DNA-binding protein [Microbacteriaceae bacterium]|nr:single-stranded DNA-binding protein [Microbacteriaceae bacterium]